MPFSGTTFSEIESARLKVADIISQNKSRIEYTDGEYGRIVSAMSAAGAEYGPLVDAAANLLATDPTNESYIVLNQFVQNHLADFNAVSAEAATKDQLVNS
jgi:hypothetical protein